MILVSSQMGAFRVTISNLFIQFSPAKPIFEIIGQATTSGVYLREDCAAFILDRSGDHPYLESDAVPVVPDSEFAAVFAVGVR
jgi:hypothetical protein